jgi:hypothetical protein
VPAAASAAACLLALARRAALKFDDRRRQRQACAQLVQTWERLPAHCRRDLLVSFEPL